MDVEVLDIPANGKTAEYAEDRFENLMGEKGIDYIKVSALSDPQRINRWLKDCNLEKEVFISGIPDYMIGHEPKFIEVKSYSDGLRKSQIEWIERFDYEVKVVFLQTRVGVFDVDILTREHDEKSRAEKSENRTGQNQLSDFLKHNEV